MAKNNAQEVQKVNNAHEMQKEQDNYDIEKTIEELTDIKAHIEKLPQEVREKTESPLFSTWEGVVTLLDFIKEHKETMQEIGQIVKDAETNTRPIQKDAEELPTHLLVIAFDEAKKKPENKDLKISEIFYGKYGNNKLPLNKRYREIVAAALLAQEQMADKGDYFPPQSITDLAQSGYRRYYQNSTINALMRATQKDFEKNKKNKQGLLVTDDSAFLTENIEDFILDAKTFMVFDVCLQKLADNLNHRTTDAEQINRGREISITVKEYAERRKIDIKEARKQLREGAFSIYLLSARIPTENGGFKYVRIVDALTDPGTDGEPQFIKNGVLKMQFTFDMASFIAQTGSIAIFPDTLFRMNLKRNPYCYSLGRKLFINYRQNYGRANACRISVESLLKTIPNLVKITQVGDQKQYTQRIREPFERDMLALCNTYGIIKNWHYCNKNGEPLTDAQQTNQSFWEWHSWLIEYELLDDYPQEMHESIAHKKKESHKRATKRKEKAQIMAAAEQIKKNGKGAHT